MKREFFIGLLMLIAATVRAGDDFQVWSQGTWNMDLYPRVLLKTHGQWRLRDDASESYFYLLSERLVVRIHDHVDAGLNYSRLNTKTSRGFQYQNRYEIELNPKISWAGFQFHNRNRIEFRHIEDRGSDHTRSRHRVQIRQKHFYTNAEFFFDHRTGNMVQNRIIPLGIRTIVGKWLKIDVFWMAQSVKTSSWETRQILGFHLQSQ